MSLGLRFLCLIFTAACPDIVDTVSLIPYRGTFEHRTLNPAVFLFLSFIEQILWASYQLDPLGSACQSGVRRIRCLHGEITMGKKGDEAEVGMEHLWIEMQG